MVIKSLRMREITEENRRPCSEHEEPSPVSLWALSSWENPAGVHKHQFLHFAFIEVVSSPTAREIRVTYCTVSLTSRIKMWRRLFCNSWKDGGIPRSSCYRLYRLPGRITQLLASLHDWLQVTMHTSMGAAMGPWPAVSGAWVHSTFFRYGVGLDYEQP